MHYIRITYIKGTYLYCTLLSIAQSCKPFKLKVMLLIVIIRDYVNCILLNNIIIRIKN